MEQAESIGAVEESTPEADGSAVMQTKVTVRLPPESVQMIDRAVENGLAATRSDALRKIFTTFQKITGPDRDLALSFVTHILNEPLELMIWMRDRVVLMAHDDDWRRREAGTMTVLAKLAAVQAGVLDKVDLAEIRERLYATMSSFDGFSLLFGAVPEPVTQAPPPAEAPSLAKPFEDLLSEIPRRIRLGAEAAEISNRLIALIMVAGVFRYYESEGVDPLLSAMAEAADVENWLGDEEDEQPDRDPDRFEDLYQDLCLCVPVLYDNLELRQQVYACLLHDLFDGPPPAPDDVAEEESDTEQQDE